MSKKFSLLPIYVRLTNLFRAGVVLCFLVLLVGILLTLVCDPQSYASLGSKVCQALNGEHVHSPRLLTAGNLFASGGFLGPSHLLELGIAILILLPVLRMWAAFVYFLSEKDVLYAVMTGVVVAVITVSLFVLSAQPAPPAGTRQAESNSARPVVL